MCSLINKAKQDVYLRNKWEKECVTGYGAISNNAPWMMYLDLF